MKLIDIGAFNGDSALHFISYPDITTIDAYDPIRGFETLWKAISKRYPNIFFKQKAVYIYTGTIDFYQRPDETPLGSTIMTAKIKGDEADTFKCKCIDILEIIPSEKFCLKLDAEGAEYDILERLIDSGKSDLIDRLYVEWHGSKMYGDYKERQQKITEHFGKRMNPWL